MAHTNKLSRAAISNDHYIKWAAKQSGDGAAASILYPKELQAAVKRVAQRGIYGGDMQARFVHPDFKDSTSPCSRKRVRRSYHLSI